MRTKLHQALQVLRRAYRAHLLGQLDKALQFAQSSLMLQPTAEAYTFLGWLHSLQGQLEEAVFLCRRAIAVDPDFGNAYSDLGAYLIQLHRYEEATLCLRKAANAPRYASYYTAYYNLGRIYDYLGEEGQAIEAYRLSLNYCPCCGQAREAYRRLVSRTN